MKHLISSKVKTQILRFIGISGIGWLIDFSIYTILVTIVGYDVGISNLISSMPAITFVFFTSTIKTFDKNNNGIPMWHKYVIYIIYQALLVSLISYLNQILYNCLIQLTFMNINIIYYGKIVTKIIITPITMTINFFVLKRLLERI